MGDFTTTRRRSPQTAPDNPTEQSHTSRRPGGIPRYLQSESEPDVLDELLAEEQTTESTVPRYLQDECSEGVEAETTESTATEESGAEETRESVSTAGETSGDEEQAESQSTEATSEESVTEESESEAPVEATAREEQSAAATASEEEATSEESEGEELENPALPAVPMARLGGFSPPRVEDPPADAVRRDKAILAESGMSADEHHDRIRLAVDQVVQAAYAAQREVIFRVEEMALQTRVSIEELAGAIPGAVEAAISSIHRVVERTAELIDIAAEEQICRIEDHTAGVDEDLQANRDSAIADIYTRLIEGSTRIWEIDQQLQEAFDRHLDDARSEVALVPLGIAQPLEGGSAPAGGGEEGQGAAGPQRMEEAEAELLDELANDEGKDAETAFKDFRCAEAVPGLVDQRQSDSEEGARRRAEDLGSDTTRAQYAILSLGLVSPSARAVEEDELGNADAERTAIDEEEPEVLTAKQQAQEGLRQKRDGAIRYLETKLEPELTENLRKSGAKAVHALRGQAKQAEVGVASLAAPMADAYREVTARMDPVIVPKRFLDARRILPVLVGLRETASEMGAQHLEAAVAQMEETLTGAREARDQQVESIGDAARKSGESVEEQLIPCRFDFEFAAYQFTGTMSEGAEATIADAIGFAERVAERLEEDTAQVRDGTNPLDQRAIDFLNGAIATEQSNYLRAVRNTKRDFTAPGAVFSDIGQAVSTDLSERARMVNNALPERSTAIAVGAFLLGGAPGIVYLYETDADEDDVFTAIGDLPWPGLPALEAKYTEYGDLQTHIRERMDDDDAQRALDLFSPDATTRGHARLEIAESSLTVWGPGTAGREAVLRGFSPEELQIVTDEGWLEETSQKLAEELHGNELRISQAYLAGHPERALAVRVEERLAQARSQGDDAIAQIGDDIQALARKELGGGFNAGFVQQGQIDEITRTALREHAVLYGGYEGTADEITDTQAQQLFIQRATADRTIYVGGDEYNPPTEVQVAVDDRVKNVVRATIEHGPQSEQAWQARAAYEVTRAEQQNAGSIFGGVSETDQMRLTTSLEDQRYYQIQREYDEASPDRKAELASQLAEARAAHESRMHGLALSLGATEAQLERAGGATAWMARRTGAIFESEAGGVGRQYGREMIEQGRASLLTGIHLATDKSGTHEDLLVHSYTGRSRTEIQNARDQYRAETHGGDLDEMLGIKQRETTGWNLAAYAAFGPVGGFLVNSFASGGEVSGDVAFKLEQLARGQPTTELDYVELAALDYEQQRNRGTGFLADVTMSGTVEQRALDQRRRRLAEQVLSALPAEARERFDADDVFTPDGRVREDIRALAFNEDGRFRGRRADRQGIRDAAHEVRLWADNYRAEIDRQESLITGAITALAIAVTAVCLLIPGVNIVVAGILTAVIAGAATMFVKAGMRGERYGWEEAATDIGMTAIEAATAGFGGAMAGGLGKSLRLAKFGEVLTARFGRVGSAMIREAITGAMSSSAQVAIQDDTWKDGFGKGFERVLGSGLRGAAVGAVAAGVSEGLEGRLGRALDPNLTNPNQARAMQRLGQSLGPGGREILREAISEAAGGMASEVVAIYADILSGTFQGGLRGALERLGMAGLRDMASGGLRSAAMGRNRARFRQLLAEARNNPNTTESDLRVLRLAAISAGEMQYDQGLTKIRQEVDAGRTALAGFPPGLRNIVQGLDAGTLMHLRGMLGSDELGSASERLELLRTISERVGDVDPRQFLRELQSGREAMRAREAEAQEQAKQQNKVRGILGSALEGPLRRVLKDVDVEGMDRLSPADLRRVSEMLQRGEFDTKLAAELVAAARTVDPSINEATFLRNLHAAVETTRAARDVERVARAKEREEVLAAVPEEAKNIFADLPTASIRQVQKLLDAGEPPSDGQVDALFRMAARNAPGLQSDTFKQYLIDAIKQVRSEREAERSARRKERFERLGEYPEALRGPLSALPAGALMQLRALQAQGKTISPQIRQSLLDMAQAEDSQVDLRLLSTAMDEAVRQPSRRVGGVEEQTLRTELLAEIPSSLRSKFSDVPILVVRADEFHAYTGSEHKGQAVTIIVDGRPVVVMKEGVDPTALREEGHHLAQIADPRWKDHVRALDERDLDQWDRLSLEEQVARYEKKVEMEIDAQQRRLGALEAERAKALDPEDEVLLRRQLEQVEQALANLTNRRAEVQGLTQLEMRSIEAGLISRPHWLDEPARLFAKVSEGPVKSRGKEQTHLQVRIIGDQPELDLNAAYRLTNIVKAAQGKNLVLVAWIPPGQSKAVLSVVHSDDANDPLNPTRPPPMIFVRGDDGKFVLEANTDGYPPLRPDQNAYYARESDGQVVVKSWAENAESPWRLKEVRGPGSEQRHFELELRHPVRPLGVVELRDPVTDEVKGSIDLAILGKTLANTQTGELPELDLKQLLDLARHFDLITSQSTFSAGKVQSDGRSFLDSLDNPHFHAIVRQHLAAILRTQSGGPHALIDHLATNKMLGEQHTHLDANATAEFFIRSGDATLQTLAKMLEDADVRNGLLGLDLIAKEAITELGQEIAPSRTKTLRDLADQFRLAFEAYQSATDPLFKERAFERVRSNLHGFLQGLAMHRPPDVRLSAGVLAQPTLIRFFAAYMQLKGLIQRSVGVDAAIARLLIDVRPSGSQVAMVEIRIGASGWARLVRITNDDWHEENRAFILSISKNVGMTNLSGTDDFDRLGLREIIQAFFRGDPELRGLVGLDSSGVESNKSGPIVHAREFSLRTLLNLQQSLPRVLENGKLFQVAAALRQAGEKELADWLQSLTPDSLQTALREFHDTYKNAESRLHVDLAGPEGKIKALETFLDSTKYGDMSLEQLAHINRIAVDVLRREGLLGSGQTRLRQLGLTIHAGEQITGEVTPLGLLAQVEMSLRLGEDRLGHGLILGMRGEDLVRLGLLQPADIDTYDQKRIELIERAKLRGVVVELNITSNQIISNITAEMHGAAELVAKGIRVSVNTDDEVLLHTSVARELHLFADMKGVRYEDVVLAALEAFASRLGAWELRGATAELVQRWQDTIAALQPDTLRDSVISALVARFLGPDAERDARAQNVDMKVLVDKVLKYVFD